MGIVKCVSVCVNVTLPHLSVAEDLRGCQNVSVPVHIIVLHWKNNGTNYDKGPSFISVLQ